MPVHIVDAAGTLLHVSFQGQLQKADYDRLTELTRQTIAREGRLRVLAVLDGFTGWERHEGWGDLGFMMNEGEMIERMAIVGEERWRDDALAFTAAGLRPTSIEFFPPTRLEEARRWLAG